MNDDPQIPEESAADATRDLDDDAADAAADFAEGLDDADDLDETVPLDRDLPCIRCGYNLRGLLPRGQCPECGASILKALNFANERVLCMACMRPNHPSAAVCGHCGAPAGAGATAAYWQMTPMGVRAPSPDADDEPAAPRKRPPRPEPVFAPSIIPVILMQIVCLPIAFAFLSIAITINTGERDSFPMAATMAFFSLIIAAIGLFPLRNYLKRRREYQRMRQTILRSAEPSASHTAPAGDNPNDSMPQ